MQLFDQFGFNPVLLAAQIVNFLIVLWVLKKFLYKPVLDVLKKRQTEIQEGLANAEKARKMLEETIEKEKSILKKAQLDAQKILQDAKTQAQRISKIAEEEAQKRTERLIDEARNQIAQDINDAQKRLTSHVSKLALEYLEKSAKQLFTPKTQSEIMEKAVKHLGKKAD